MLFPAVITLVLIPMRFRETVGFVVELSRREAGEPWVDHRLAIHSWT